MCILFVALGQHPDFPVVIAANRDEYYARPSEKMHYWHDQPDILAGRDLQAGGTWLGINRRGGFAAVTNFRAPGSHRPDALSRGTLVTSFLSEGHGPNHVSRFDRMLCAQSQHYNPFNLIFGDASIFYAWDHGSKSTQRLSDGFHSISNGPLDQRWPKMSRGVEHLTRYIRTNSVLDADHILGIMQDSTAAKFEQLPDTGLDPQREQMLSSIFIKGSTYGTRTTTVLLYRMDEIQVTEWNFGPDATLLSASQFVVKPAQGED